MKRRMVAIVLAGALIASLSACTSSKKSEEPAAEPSAAVETQEDVISADLSVDEPEAEAEEPESKDESQQSVEASEFDFSQVSHLEFIFESGAGAWDTVVHIHDDGSFEGIYHDSDMGDIDEGYPDGTLYYSEFSGKFTDVKKKNDYTYSMKIVDMKTVNASGTEEISNDLRVIYTDPYGLEKSDEILLYLPGAPLNELPEAYKGWIFWSIDQETDDTLPFYGLYNVAQEEGFSSYDASLTEGTEEFDLEAVTDSADVSDIDQELRDIEAQAQALEESLANDDLTQMEYNMKTGELYQLWDGELNRVWGYLKTTLSESDLEKLRTEQLAWIKAKEAAIDEAGAEYEGGSMQPMIRNEKGAEVTKARVYELADILKAN